GDQFVQEMQPEPLGLLGGIERDGIFFSARRAEEVRGAAYGEHQRIVMQRPGREYFLVQIREHRLQVYGSAASIDAVELAQDEGESAILGQHEVRQRLAMDVQRAGGYLVQGRLPDMPAGSVHQDHVLGAKLPTQLGGKLEASRASAY